VALWVPALFALARRLTGAPARAAVVTLLGVLVGPPNYPAAMPSWYNLFLATWGLWALVLWSERRRPLWLVLAGACGGLSILMKIPGLFFVAAALFYVLHLEAVHPADAKPDGSGPTKPSRSWLFAAAATAAVILLVTLETLLIRSQMGAATWVNFVLATVFLGGALVWRAWAVRDGLRALQRTLASWALLLLGVLIPLVPFLGWFAAAGGLEDLYRGVFLLPLGRTTLAAAPVAPLRPSIALILVPTVCLLAAPYAGMRIRLLICAMAAAATARVLVAMDPLTFNALFTSLLLLVPLVTGAGAALLLFRPPGTASQRAALLATLWTVALVHLVRYPFAGPIYFTYVAPLAVLAAASVLSAWQPRRARDEPRALPGSPVPAVVAAFYALFYLVGPNRGGLFGPLTPEPESQLALERGRIAVPAAEAMEYQRLVETVRLLSRSPFTYATPDAPEVYFLAGFENPTRVLFEIFEGTETDVQSTLQLLAARDVNVVVVNTQSFFSTLSGELEWELMRAYPRSVQIGRFVVRWQGEPEPGDLPRR
jgi:hypothetical protein